MRRGWPELLKTRTALIIVAIVELAFSSSRKLFCHRMSSCWRIMGMVEGKGSGGKLDTRTLRSIVNPPLHVLREIASDYYI